MATDWFIVKIQLSEFPRNESVLAYNEDKSCERRGRSAAG